MNRTNCDVGAPAETDPVTDGVNEKHLDYIRPRGNSRVGDFRSSNCVSGFWIFPAYGAEPRWGRPFRVLLPSMLPLTSGQPSLNPCYLLGNYRILFYVKLKDNWKLKTKGNGKRFCIPGSAYLSAGGFFLPPDSF